MAAPCSNVRLSGSANTETAGTAARSPAPPYGSTPTTRCPGSRPGPLTTVPATSTPRVKGGSGFIWYFPLLSNRSGNETPTACTSMSTSCSPGIGSSTSRTTTSAGPVGVTTWAARMGRSCRSRSTRADDRVGLEVHGVGVTPVPAPGEAPRLEDRDHGAVHLADGAALVAGHVQVEG